MFHLMITMLLVMVVILKMMMDTKMIQLLLR